MEAIVSLLTGWLSLVGWLSTGQNKMAVYIITRWAVRNRVAARRGSTVTKYPQYLSYLIQAGTVWFVNQAIVFVEFRSSTQASLLA